MGYFVDNTHTHWGKFKPWIAIGGVGGGILTVLLFTDLGLSGAGFIVVFTLVYLGWDIIYGMNDIAYWSMLPSLTLDQKERERTGAFVRICTNMGLFSLVVSILPTTKALGGDKMAWFLFAVGIVVVMFAFLSFTLFGVREDPDIREREDKTTLREMFSVLFKNDQLLIVAVSMALFMLGYSTTASFGVYYFKYAFKDEGMYMVFALVLGAA